MVASVFATEEFQTADIGYGLNQELTNVPLTTNRHWSIKKNIYASNPIGISNYNTAPYASNYGGYGNYGYQQQNRLTNTYGYNPYGYTSPYIIKYVPYMNQRVHPNYYESYLYGDNDIPYTKENIYGGNISPYYNYYGVNPYAVTPLGIHHGLNNYGTSSYGVSYIKPNRFGSYSTNPYVNSYGLNTYDPYSNGYGNMHYAGNYPRRIHTGYRSSVLHGGSPIISSNPQELMETSTVSPSLMREAVLYNDAGAASLRNLPLHKDNDVYGTQFPVYTKRDNEPWV